MSYYDILGVPQSATQEEIKRAYREQVKFFHPDVFQGSPEVAREKTLQLNEAYAVLHDPDQRREYDYRLQFEQRKAAEEARRRQEEERERAARREQQEREEARRREEAEQARRQAEERERERARAEQEAAWNRQQAEWGQEHGRAGSGTTQGPEKPPETPPRDNTTQAAPQKEHRTGTAGMIWKAAAVVCAVVVALLAWQVGRLGAENSGLAEKNQRLEAELAAQEAGAQEAVGEADKLRTELEEQRSMYDLLWDDFYFYYSNVGITFDNDQVYYHNVLCPRFTGDVRFGAHNTLYCESLGFIPCPECWSILAPG